MARNVDVVKVIRDAFAAVPRSGFLPRKVAHRASYDGPIEIGQGQTNSQPRTVRDMLRLIDVRPGARVLDVGSGSGWTTALLAYLTGPTGSVLGVEIRPELVALGRANMRAAAFDWAAIEPTLPGVIGRPDMAPFDCILVSAEAQTLPQGLAEQLDDGGRLVIPISGALLLLERLGDERTVSRHGHYRFVPLVTH